MPHRPWGGSCKLGFVFTAILLLSEMHGVVRYRRQKLGDMEQ